MSKPVAKAIAAIGTGGLTAAVVWLLALAHLVLDPTSPAGGAVLTLIASGAAWLVGKAVAAQGPATPSSEYSGG